MPWLPISSIFWALIIENLYCPKCFTGFPVGSASKESACSAGDLGSNPGMGRFPGQGTWLPTPVFLPGVLHGQRSLVSYSPWGCKESDTTERQPSPQQQIRYKILKIALLLVPFYRCKNCCSEKQIAQGYTVSVPFLCQCVLSSVSHLCPSVLQGRKLHVPGSPDEASW